MRNENIEIITVEIETVKLMNNLKDCNYSEDEISAILNAVFQSANSTEITKCKLRTCKLKSRD